MIIQIKIDAKSKRVIADLKNMPVATRRGIRQAFYLIGRDIKKTWQDNVLKKGRSGRVYKIRGRRHIASDPGETAANISGTYRRSIDFKASGADNMRIIATAPHAGYLEDGTSKMEPRPGGQIAIDENERNIENNFPREILRELNK